MKKLKHIIRCILLSIILLSSCIKDGNETILVNNPQTIPFITEYMPMDLLMMFEENNVYFGDRPPIIEFEFSSNNIFDTTNLPSPYAPQPGDISPVIRYHKFCNQYLAISDYIGITSEEEILNIVTPIYITGYDNFFTAYYYQQSSTWGSPTYAVVISGKITDEGISNYRYGYKIIQYTESEIPDNVYPVNSIFIFKDINGLARYDNWYDKIRKIN